MIFLFSATIFLSSFLLFVVQPLLGKYLLPWFGGSPAVWTTCMLFSQALLLAGYSYAHLLVGRTRLSRQALTQFLFLAAAIAALPILPSGSWKPAGASLPFWRIMGMLAAGAAAPYLALSAVSPLLQSWYVQARPGESPYRLYSVSNLGSLLAIVSYPILIEPNISLNRQARLWSWLYALFVILCGFCGLRAWQSRAASVDRGMPVPADPDGGIDSPIPSRGRRLLWLVLPACGSIMLLATTNQLCQDVAVIPLLWMVPLGLYLLSFILCFHSTKWYSRLWSGPVLALTLAQACYILYGSIYVDLRIQIASYSLTLFICCMVCHGELVKIKPAVRHLTSFYWIIAAGGAMGGLIVSLGAPMLFKGIWEFHLGLAATAILFLQAPFADQKSPLQGGRPFWAWTLLYAAVACLFVVLGFQMLESSDDRIDTTRNFFGVLRVLEQESNNPGEHRFTLMNGRIEHGFQFQAENKRQWPTSYFGPGSGIGIALRYHPNRVDSAASSQGMRIGVVGLGAGTIASYCRKGDSICFYEINPDVLRFSGKHFSYLRDCAGTVDLTLGDARISLEREKERGERRQFDVLGIDAFSGDAIPVHLLTKECFELYQYHLKPDGILAFHISSRYFDLAPVIRSLTALEPEVRRRAVMVAARSNQSQGVDSSDWVLITSNERFLESNEVRRAIQPWTAEDRPPLLWTDDYSNLLHLLR